MPSRAITKCVVVWLASHLLAIGSVRAQPVATPFRMGFSSAMFSDVNENDAKAALKVWGRTLAKERGVPTDPQPKIFKDLAALQVALASNQVDAVGMTLIEFGQLRCLVRFAPLFVAQNRGHATEQYVLLTPRESGAPSLAGLRGRALILLQNHQLCLARPWLESLLLGQHLPPVAEFFGQVTHNTKLSRVVLPVFFRQAEACVVTRRGFDTMVELNPQVGNRLEVLATSVELVPAVFAFRADYNPPFKAELLRSVNELHHSPAGQQVLTIFQCEQISEQPASCLEKGLELLHLPNVLLP